MSLYLQIIAKFDLYLDYYQNRYFVRIQANNTPYFKHKAYKHTYA